MASQQQHSPGDPREFPRIQPSTVSPNTSLARWVHQQSLGPQTGPWEMYFSRDFANLWYGARAAGEQIRGLALERLYRARPLPGGPHPDPREPGVFSPHAVLSVSAELLGLHLNPMLLNPASEDHDDDELDHDPETGILLPFAWIITHHATNNRLGSSGEYHGEYHQERHRRPEIVIRTLHANQYLLEYEIASLLGYWHHEHQRLNDPMAPTSTITVPKEAGIVSLLHQYAIALLCLPRDCPASWTCHCNAIRARFNEPPPDHESPTSVFSLAEIEAASANRRRTDPLFPYNGANPWTNDSQPDEQKE